MTSGKKEKECSTLTSWSRPDGDQFGRGPISSERGRVIVNELYLLDPDYIRLAKKVKSEAKLYALLSVLYFCDDPETPNYQNVSRERRLAKVLETQAPDLDQDEIKDLVRTEEYELLRESYLELVTTPAKRMLEAFTDQVNQYVDETTRNRSLSGDEIQKRIIRGRELLEELNSLQAYVLKEGDNKTRGDYRPALFERRESANMA